MGMFTAHIGQAKATKPVATKTAPAELVDVPTIAECLRYIAGFDADRARELNGVGFNQQDSTIGHIIARKPFEEWHNWERDWAFKKIRFYRRQLEAGGLRWDLVGEPKHRIQPDPIKTVELMDSGAFFKVTFQHLPQLEFEATRQAMSAVPGRQWVAHLSYWLVPRDSISAKALRSFAVSHGFDLSPDVSQAFFEAIDRAELMLEGSRAVKPFNDFQPRVVATSLTPWPHQTAGRAYAKLAGYKLVIADQMGTGKTGLALLACEDAGVFEKDLLSRRGVLVICPASVKLNWAREAAMWAPGRSVTVLSGSGLQSVKGDIVIGNYDILRGHDEDVDDPLDAGDLVKLLSLRKWAAIILDECHYVKSVDAQRTVAIARVLKATNPRVRLMLSGSPILNRVSEFVTALDFAGCLEHFGGAYRFLSSYVGSTNTWRLKEMNQKLREGGPMGGGYLCRLKDHHAFDPEGRFVHIDDVPHWAAPDYLRERFEDETEDQRQIEALRAYMKQNRFELVEGAMKLPAKVRSLQLVELSDRKEYDRAVAEFRSWLWEQIQAYGGDIDSWNRALRAEALVKLNKLRMLVGRLKTAAAVAWTRNFLESSEGKLVVFVEHDFPQDSFREAFEGCAYITGGQSAEARQANIDRFQQDPECRLIVSKIKAGGVGVTLTAAADVMFMELGWNPGTMDQAEDRLHRGGQTKSVTCHYLLAERTIDQKMAQLIDEKRAVVTAATHGGDVPEGSSISAILEDIAA